MLAKVKSHWPIIALVLISVLLCIRNYTPGTFLSGWDTLHPEFNFKLGFERALFGVFRTEEGLGAVGAHSDITELVRVAGLYILHFFLATSFLRYFYIFLNLILGTLGMYLFLYKYLLKNKEAGFLGALFYLLNIGTVQIFNVPFEMFTTLFATLPFIFYFASGFIIEKVNKVKTLFLFSFISLLNAPSAYAATLWYVFFAFFVVYFLSFALINYSENKNSLKNFIILSIVFIVVNLFWLIPNIYFVLNHGTEVQHANINLLFSDQAFLKNKEFGNIKDILSLKTFYFDWNIYQGNNRFTDLLSPYINHLKDIKVLSLVYLFALSYIFGAFVYLKKFKLKSLPLLFALLFSLIFLINDNFPFSHLFNFLQNHIPFFKEAFRFPDDKILNEYVFIISIFFAFSANFFIEKLKKTNLKAISILIISVLIVYYSLPSFFGNFINYNMKVKIPNYYFQLFDYLNTQSSFVRVANLPINSPWGWVYYNWNPIQNLGHVNSPSYQGAGFLYFGIKQPLLDRDFDRWSPYNESYYREMSYAIYKNDEKILSNVIKKYNIGFIFIDKSVANPQNPASTLDFDKSKNLIENTGMIIEEKIFGKIELLKLKTNQDSIVSSLNTNINILPSTTTTYHDFAYAEYGNYISSSDVKNFSNLFFPFRNLINNQSRLYDNLLNIDSAKITFNVSSSINTFNLNTSQNYPIIPSDLIAEKNGKRLALSFYLNTPVLGDTPSSTPIKTEAEIGNSTGSLYMSINQNQLLKINNIGANTPVAVGKVLIKNDDNLISIFDQNKSTSINNISQIINPFFSSCDQTTPPNVGFGINSIQIRGKGNICILIPYGYLSNFTIRPTSSVLTNFSFQFSGDAKISSCLFDQQTSECLFYQDATRLGNVVSFSFPLDFNKVGSTALKIFIEPTRGGENNYILQNLTSWYSKSITDLIIPRNTILNSISTVNNLSFNKIYLPKNIIYNPGFAITDIQKLESDCKSPTTEATKKIVEINGSKAVEYNSQLGSFCDHFSYPNLSHKQGYLIVIDSKNQSGLTPTLCATNYTSRKCDIYANLTSYNTKFGQDVFLLPPMDESGLGYDINLENLAIKGSPSVNFISTLDIIPIPYDFLEKINSEQKSYINFDLKIRNTTIYNPSFYVAEYSGTRGILSLGLSFERGFMAYKINCSGKVSCLIKGTLAPFASEPIKEHVLVNNWANGWLINDTRLNSPNTKIAIVYVPQYFEYLGVFIIVLLFLFLIVFYLK